MLIRIKALKDNPIIIHSAMNDLSSYIHTTLPIGSAVCCVLGVIFANTPFFISRCRYSCCTCIVKSKKRVCEYQLLSFVGNICEKKSNDRCILNLFTIKFNLLSNLNLFCYQIFY